MSIEVEDGAVAEAVENNEVKTEQQEEQQSEQQTENKAGETEGAAASDDEELVITIGDEKPTEEEEEAARAPQWVRELRKSKRETDRENRELKEELARLKNGGKSATVVLGEKPTLESCDYDGERFEQELTAWHERKRKVEAEAENKRKAEEQAQATWNATLESYNQKKSALKVSDYQDAEDAVTEALNVVQQGIILNGAESPEKLVYALGKNPKKAKELASIADPVKFAFAVAKLETQLKVTPKKTAPMPEKVVRGSAPVSGSVDSQLERLRDEAVRTGDMSKVIAYKRQKRT